MSPANPGAGVHQELRGKRDFLLRSAAALVSTSLVTSALGFAYWALAARAFDAADVGESATAISAMSVIAPFTVLGLGSVLVVRLPKLDGDRPRLVATATLATGVIGSLVALLCALALPSAFLGLPGIGHHLGITALFVAATATQGMGMLMDSALLSLVGGATQLRRNAIQATAKLVLLAFFALALSRFGSVAIFASWFIANAVSLAAVAALLMRRLRVSPGRLLPRPSMLRGLSVDAARHHLLNTALFIPYFAMPIVGNVVLGSEQAGYLYAIWSVAGLLFLLPISLATALFATGARDIRAFGVEFRFTLRSALLICLAGNLGVAALGGLVLGVFGEAYAQSGRTALTLMCLGGLGLVVKDHHVVVARVGDTVGREALLIGALGAGELTGAALGAALGGLSGLSLGWLAAIALEVVVCGPLVWRAYRGAAAPARPTPGTRGAGVRARRWRAVAAVAAMFTAAAAGSLRVGCPAGATPVAAGSVVDDFSGPAGSPPDPRLWAIDTGSSAEHGWERGSVQTYTDDPRNVGLDGRGHLILRARRSGDGYTSGRVVTRGRLAFPLGTVSARIKFPAGQGIWPAFWMLGSDVGAVGWPRAGEVDIMEMVNSASVYHVALHAPGAELGQSGQLGDLGADFHVFWAARRPGGILVGVDRTTLAAFSPASMPAGSSWVFDGPMFVLLNVAVGGDWPGPPDRATPPQAAMVVDWLRFDPRTDPPR